MLAVVALAVRICAVFVVPDEPPFPPPPGFDFPAVAPAAAAVAPSAFLLSAAMPYLRVYRE